MLEKDIENLVALYPEEFFPNAGFKLIGQQVKLDRCYADIVFIDKYSRTIIVEVKRDTLTRDAAGQILEYYGILKQQNPEQIIELILCANTIPHERRIFLEKAGIECKELNTSLISNVAKKYNYKFIDKPIKHIEKVVQEENQQPLIPENHAEATVKPEPMKKANGIIQATLESILTKYPQATPGEKFGKDHYLWPLFIKLQDVFVSSGVIRKHPNIKVSWSAGKGILAKVPWIAFLDSRETNTTQKGVSSVLFFRQDMSGFYLTLIFGITEFISQYGEQAMASHTKELRERFKPLLKGFDLDDGINLRTDGKLGKQYEKAIIAYKFYNAKNIFDDTVILQDLDTVLNAYEQYLAQKKGAR